MSRIRTPQLEPHHWGNISLKNFLVSTLERGGTKKTATQTFTGEKKFMRANDSGGRDWTRGGRGSKKGGTNHGRIRFQKGKLPQGLFLIYFA